MVVLVRGGFGWKLALVLSKIGVPKEDDDRRPIDGYWWQECTWKVSMAIRRTKNNHRYQQNVQRYHLGAPSCGFGDLLQSSGNRGLTLGFKDRLGKLERLLG